jgi:hypothetical protein
MDAGNTASLNAELTRETEARAAGSSRPSTSVWKRSGNLSSRSSRGEAEEESPEEEEARSPVGSADRRREDEPGVDISVGYGRLSQLRHRRRGEGAR